MRAFDETGLNLAKFQGELFAESARLLECSSAVFVRRFMRSHVAQRMDSAGFLFESSSITSVFQELDEQFGASSYGSVRFNPEALYWMGYLYRYWCYVFEMPSSDVFKIIGGRELAALYEPYHSLDPAAAIQRILEAKGLPDPLLSRQEREEELVARGVEALRRIRAGRFSPEGYEYYCARL